MNTYTFKAQTVRIGILGVLFSLVALLPLTSEAATCTFSRDLQLGVVGEDVKCLQQYLNGNGFVIAGTGPGAPGKETDEYKALTQAAVIKWQIANQISPAQGYFGVRSRTVFNSLLSGGSQVTNKPVTTSPQSSGNALIDQLQARLAELQKQNNAVTKKPAPAEDKKIVKAAKSDTSAGADARKLLAEVLEMLDEVEEGIDDSDDTAGVKAALGYKEDAEEEIFKGLRFYVSEQYSKADSRFEDALEWAQKALDEVGGGGERGEASDLLEEVEEKIDEVKDLIDEADADGKETREAEEYLDEAEDLFADAEDALDDKDYSEAIDLLEEAEDVLDDALDAIGKRGGSDVEDMLDDARDDLDDARDDVDEALDDGKRVGDAEDLLDEAEDLLDDAEDALDDGDDRDAKKLIKDALDLIDEALDEF